LTVRKRLDVTALAQAEQVAPTTATVPLRGETGTGKAVRPGDST
jgi:transcriptional regulator with PAS, ATPase and Fis domain